MELSLLRAPPLRCAAFGSSSSGSGSRRSLFVAHANKKPLVSSSTAVQFSIGVFVLGFLDAGYSGDWSRIGVLSKESEAVIRDAAFAVVPISLGLITWINRDSK